MKQVTVFFCKSVFWVLIVIFGLALTNSFAGIKVGVAEVVITPPNPVGVAMAGYDRGENTSTGVHDDLYARSIVVQGEDETAVAMISLALVNMSEEIMDSIRSGVERETGIPFKNVIISATHTHSGPVLGTIDDEYVKFLIRQSVNSAASAWEGRVPGKIGVSSMSVFGLALNDRRMEFGGIPDDPEAAVIKIEDMNGHLLGVFFNFGCHPSVLDLSNLLFTEDWPYFAIKGIKEALGSDVVVGYFQAAQGDAKVGYNAELSAVGAYMQDLRTFEFAAQKGNIMTEAVLKLLPSIATTDDIPVRVSYDKFAVPRRTTFPYAHAEALAWQDKARKTLEEKEKLVLLYPTNKAEVEQLRQASLKAVAEGKTYEDPRLEVYTQPCCGRLTPVNIGGLVGLRNGLPAGQRGTDLDLNYSYLGSKWLPIASGGTNEPDVLMDAAEVYFLRAEGALRGWSMGGMVKDLYNEGIRMSINAKTTVSDGVIDAYINSTKTPVAPKDKDGNPDQFNSPPVTDIPVKFDEGGSFERQLEQIITQKWLALFPMNDVEAWAERRRTGYPRGYAIIESTNPDVPATALMRRLRFPPSAYTQNNTATVAAVDLLSGPDRNDTRLWWDAKPLDSYPTPTDPQ